MKNLALLLSISLIISGTLYGQIGGRQTFFEFQAGVGPTVLLTDIGGIGLGGNIELNGKYRLHPNLALKAGIGAALGVGSDQGTENESRGMSYYTILTELTGQLEYYILKEGRGYGKGGHVGYKPRVRPYLYAGGGPLFFFPTYTHENAEELPSFSNYTVILIGGAGFLYRVNADVFWGFQIGGRLTTTDFLDGFSPADAAANDNYISAQFVVAYRF